MKILYISDRQDGGILRHVRCLRQCLPADVESFEIGLGGDEEFAGRSGHDFRELWQIRRVIRVFKPDIVHLHCQPLMMLLYLKYFTSIPRICSLHTPSRRKVAWDRHILNLTVQPCYFLAVSSKTWKRFLWNYPKAQGAVFYNPLRVGDAQGCGWRSSMNARNMIVGMLGRNADVKDWPSYIKLSAKMSVSARNVSFWGIGISKAEAIAKYGELANRIEWKGFQPNGREWIGKVDVFVLTSKEEEMPTVVLEAFAERTAICGFIPEGGMSEILSFSTGPLKEVFIKERDTSRLAEIVVSLLKDDVKRNAVIEDGWQILTNHFDAEKNCKGQLMDIYRRMTK